MSDSEAVVVAVEEAQRILAVYDEAATRKNQDDFVAMLQFILCNPSVALAMRRLKSRSRLGLVEAREGRPPWGCGEVPQPEVELFPKKSIPGSGASG